MTTTLTKDIERRILTSAAKPLGLSLRKRKPARRDDQPADQGDDGKPADKGQDDKADKGQQDDDSQDDKPDRADADSPGTIEGYAAVFYDEADPGTEYKLWSDPWFSAIERIARGAFSRAVKEGDDVRGLVDHDPSRIIGRTASGTLRLVEDERGLRFEDDLPDTGTGRDLAASVGRGDIDGCSFGFVVEQESWRDTEMPDGKRVAVRTIESVRLLDVGPVTYPAYAATSVGGRSRDGGTQRALGDVNEARVSYERWKEGTREGQSVEANMRARRLRLAEVEAAI